MLQVYPGLVPPEGHQLVQGLYTVSAVLGLLCEQLVRKEEMVSMSTHVIGDRIPDKSQPIGDALVDILKAFSIREKGTTFPLNIRERHCCEPKYSIP